MVLKLPLSSSEMLPTPCWTGCWNRTGKRQVRLTRRNTSTTGWAEPEWWSRMRSADWKDAFEFWWSEMTAISKQHWRWWPHALSYTTSARWVGMPMMRNGRPMLTLHWTMTMADRGLWDKHLRHWLGMPSRHTWWITHWCDSRYLDQKCTRDVRSHIDRDSTL